MNKKKPMWILKNKDLWDYPVYIRINSEEYQKKLEESHKNVKKLKKNLRNGDRDS